MITETHTDVILGWEEFRISYSNRCSDNSVHVAPVGRKTRVGILIKGQLNIVHVQDEVSVLSDVALHSLSKGRGWPVTFITVFRHKDNKEGKI